MRATGSRPEACQKLPGPALPTAWPLCGRWVWLPPLSRVSSLQALGLLASLQADFGGGLSPSSPSLGLPAFFLRTLSL